MKKKIFLPVLIVSCFIGAGMGSVVESSQLQANIFWNLWEKLISAPEKMEESSSILNFERFITADDTRRDFEELHKNWQEDFYVLIGRTHEDEFAPGIILKSDLDTYEQIKELKRTLNMVSVGVDTLQDKKKATIIRTTETDEQWAEIKDEEGGYQKKTELESELYEIIEAGKTICQRQRSEIKCE